MHLKLTVNSGMFDISSGMFGREVKLDYIMPKEDHRQQRMSDANIQPATQMVVYRPSDLKPIPIQQFMSLNVFNAA